MSSDTCATPIDNTECAIGLQRVASISKVDKHIRCTCILARDHYSVGYRKAGLSCRKKAASTPMGRIGEVKGAA